MNETKKRQKEKKHLTMKQSGYIFVAVFMTPPLLHLAIFVILPALTSIGYAFTDEYSGAFTLQNFREVMYSVRDTTSGDSLFVCFTNTVKYALRNLIMMPFELLLTYFLYKRIKGHNFFRIAFLLPAIIPGLVWVTAYREIVSMNGILGKVMEHLGRPLEYSLFKNPDTATPMLLIYGVWLGLAGSMLYYYSAMSRIPDSVLEAALLDGCGPFRELTKIVLPLIAPTFGTMLLLQIAGFIGATGPILLFTKGAAGTSTLNFYLYYTVLTDPTGGIGVVSALGLMMTAVALPLTLISRTIINKRLPEVEY